MIELVTYIYALTDPRTGAIRYVGKSDSPFRRFEVHLCDRSDTRKGRWIRRLLLDGVRPSLRILQIVRRSEWQQAERGWIAKAEQDGAMLTNSTAGGIGPGNPTEETRAKMRAAKLGRRISDAQRAKQSASMKGRTKPPRSAEHIAKIAAARAGQAPSREHREKLRLAGMAGRARNALGLKGVYFDHKRSRYQAHIKVQKKMIHLGRFDTAKEAAAAYNAAAVANGWPPEGLNQL
jgi:hypothetical protein